VLTLLTFLLLGIVLSFVPVLGIVVSLCLNCIGFVAIPAAITERLDPLTALGRSSHLSAGRYRTTFALMLASAAVAVIPTGVAHVSLVMWHDAMSSYSFEWMAQLRPYALAMVALSSLLMPFQGTVRAVSYVQLRRDSPGVEGDLAQVFE
jgi:hypothetical protein